MITFRNYVIRRRLNDFKLFYNNFNLQIGVNPLEGFVG
jgi:hypothetical protein